MFGGRIRGKQGLGPARRRGERGRGGSFAFRRRVVQMRGEVARFGARGGVHLHAQELCQSLVLLPGCIGPAHGGIQAHQKPMRLLAQGIPRQGAVGGVQGAVEVARLGQQARQLVQRPEGGLRQPLTRPQRPVIVDLGQEIPPIQGNGPRQQGGLVGARLGDGLQSGLELGDIGGADGGVEMDIAAVGDQDRAVGRPRRLHLAAQGTEGDAQVHPARVQVSLGPEQVTQLLTRVGPLREQGQVCQQRSGLVRAEARHDALTAAHAQAAEEFDSPKKVHVVLMYPASPFTPVQESCQPVMRRSGR